MQCIYYISVRELVSPNAGFRIHKISWFLSWEWLRSVTEMAEKAPLRVVVTGAAGQIAYSLLYQVATCPSCTQGWTFVQVASGYVFGEDQVKVQYIANYSCPVLIWPPPHSPLFSTCSTSPWPWALLEELSWSCKTALCLWSGLASFYSYYRMTVKLIRDVVATDDPNVAFKVSSSAGALKSWCCNVLEIA